MQPTHTPQPTNQPQLPRHIDEAQVLSAISVEKDVDGLHPMHMGRLAMKVCVCVAACGSS